MSNFIFNTIKNEIKSTLSIGLPLIASQLIYACSSFVATAMVARLGQDALAASVLVSMIWMTLLVLFFGILNAVSVLVSHQFGAKNNIAISEIMGQAFILGAILACIMVLLLLCIPYFLQFTTHSANVLKLSMQYMYALTWTTPSLVVLIICEQFLAGVNQAKLVLRISLLVVPLEIPLIYILIFGKFHLPACGLAGIGYGFATTYTIVALSLVIFLMKSKRYQTFGVFKKINVINKKYLRELLKVGLPMGCMHLIEVSAFAFATFWLARFGTTMLAAHQIIMQYLNFGITIVFAMSQAITVRVGHAVGRKDLSCIRLAIYVGMLLNSVCMAVIALLLNLFPKLFLQIDLNVFDPKNALLVKYGSIFIGIGGILMLFDNFRIIGFGALRGLKDTKFPMISSFIAFWLIGLSSAYFLGFILQLQGQGIWWGLTIGIACGALMVFIRIQWLLKRLDLEKLVG